MSKHHLDLLIAQIAQLSHTVTRTVVSFALLSASVILIQFALLVFHWDKPLIKAT